MSHKEITQEEVVELLRKRGRLMTYVVRNWLAYVHPGVKTYQVRRILERMEKQGLVERSSDHPYATQIGWCLPKSQEVSV